MPEYADISYSRHAERRMRQRRLPKRDVELALRTGEGYAEEDGTWIYELGHIRVVIVDRGGTAHVVTVVRLRRHT